MQDTPYKVMSFDSRCSGRSRAAAVNWSVQNNIIPVPTSCDSPTLNVLKVPTGPLGCGGTTHLSKVAFQSGEVAEKLGNFRPWPSRGRRSCWSTMSHELLLEVHEMFFSWR